MLACWTSALQVMALLAYLYEFKQNYGPHLIIVPNAVIVNWKAELQHVAARLPLRVLTPAQRTSVQSEFQQVGDSRRWGCSTL